MVAEALVSIAAVIGCLGVAIGFFAQNALLRLVADNAPELWEFVGRPSGVFSGPRGSILSQGVPLGWLLHPPRWVLTNLSARAQLLRMRIGFVLLLLGFSVGFAAATWPWVR